MYTGRPNTHFRSWWVGSIQMSCLDNELTTSVLIRKILIMRSNSFAWIYPNCKTETSKIIVPRVQQGTSSFISGGNTVP